MSKKATDEQVNGKISQVFMADVDDLAGDDEGEQATTAMRSAQFIQEQAFKAMAGSTDKESAFDGMMNMPDLQELQELSANRAKADKKRKNPETTARQLTKMRTQAKQARNQHPKLRRSKLRNFQRMMIQQLCIWSLLASTRLCGTLKRSSGHARGV